LSRSIFTRKLVGFFKSCGWVGTGVPRSHPPPSPVGPYSSPMPRDLR
jgi:hypothetical protein